MLFTAFIVFSGVHAFAADMRLRFDGQIKPLHLKSNFKTLLNMVYAKDWVDYKELGRKKTMKLPAAEFIRRFLLHVLPKGFCKIRYYGIFASRNRNEVLLKCKKVLAYPQDAMHPASKSKLAGLSWQDALLVITGMDILKCPACKKGNMVTTELLIGYRAPPGSVAIFVP